MRSRRHRDGTEPTRRRALDACGRGLFGPLRSRVQDAIDRHFYRTKYDLAQTVESFSHSIRQEVELNALVDDLVTVVQETMEPASVSLWLRDPHHPTLPCPSRPPSITPQPLTGAVARYRCLDPRPSRSGLGPPRCLPPPNRF